MELDFWDKPPIEEVMASLDYDDSDDELEHYGMPRRSGRYPWGSGDAPGQHGSGDFVTRVQSMRSSGFTYTDKDGKTWTGDNAIAKSMGLTSTQFRVQYAVAKDARRAEQVASIKSMQQDGLSNVEIGKRLGINESSVRSLLNAESEARMNAAKQTAEAIKKQVDSKGIVDVGAGAELGLNVSRQKMDEALAMLEMEGYVPYNRRMAQVTNKDQRTTLKLMCKPGTEYSEVFDESKIHSLDDYITHDKGETFEKSFTYPASMDSKRLMIRYAEEGGLERDGCIELRRGCKDLDLGTSNYAQVRILVDGTHYLKGMAVYADDLPKGVDVRFNTNKTVGTPLTKVIKPIKEDPANPFGALIKEHGGQSYYIDDNGNKQLSLINKTREEGDWSKWSDKLPSQFLAKQNISLVKRQLKLAELDTQNEYEEICKVTNPTVKKKLLEDFSNNCDSAAVHLQAASLPRQKFKVILPVPGLKDDEVYAPTYQNGEKLALVRYPHGGTFEIPIVTVNNKNAEGRRMIGNKAIDAIGINSKVAGILSGADFDGDTVTCIPTAGNGKNMSVKITSTVKRTADGKYEGLKGLTGFDPTASYGGKADGTFKVMKNTQNEMGKVSNLITDMTLKGAKPDELARAVRHSMVVIDAEKHKLDYRQSYADNGIAELKKKYQGSYDADGNYHEGAGTLLSRAKSPINVPKRVGSPQISKETGEITYKTKEEHFIDKDGKDRIRTQHSTKMAETKDARTLLSSNPNPKEVEYANYANHMKAMANKARKEMVTTKDLAYSKEAKEKYTPEVNSLNAKLNVALKNAPKERTAQAIANAAVKERKKFYDQDTSMPDAEKKKQIKKISQQELTKARLQVGAKKENIKITDKEWEAIQSGAISANKLKQIMNNSDMDTLRKLATPRSSVQISQSKVNKIKAMSKSGYTLAEIAEACGVSTSTVSDQLS